MPVKEFVFSKTDLVQGLAAAGFEPVTLCSCRYHWLESGRWMARTLSSETCKETLEALVGVIGASGTLFVPAFTLSFDRSESSTQSILLTGGGLG